MATDVSEALEQFVQERNISEELALQIVENTILAAYKRKFGSSENAVVRFDDGNRHVTIFAKKQVVDGVYDPVTEIELEEAKKFEPETEEGDEILIELDPRDFGRLSVQSAKQTVHQNSREIRKDSLYSEYKDKEGDIIIGYYQRERTGTIYVDLGKIEGVLPKKFQSPREIYHVNDRIKALIHKVEKTQTGLSVVLSRTHTEFVRAIFEMEVPEVYDKTIEIHKIVREPGYRTKLAVYSTNKDVDPVGSCVGPKGARIQAIIRELEGEKIDILKYDTNPEAFIKNALSPAEVKDVYILDEATHRALAIVAENQLSLAIGKQGLNVRLANRLVDWNIDVKTVAQFEEMDVSAETRRAVQRLFGEDEEEITRLAELPGVDITVVNILLENGIDLIEDFFAAEEDGRLTALDALTAEQKESIHTLIAECEVDETTEEGSEESEESSAGIVEEGEAEKESEEEEVYECPECGAAITIDMSRCPNCGVELSFEYEEE
ncbi:MAG: transcription termination factor NusA [Spirochaetaceae bacterium]|jgi:N utilization substance protein A|nr:transcription termination factor NusA [Spirochaetaceae bacterium]